jgi:hypothetical protein
VLTNQISRALRRATRRRRHEDATTDLAGLEPFPEPTVMISLRYGRTFRALDDEGRPMLIITDGVSAAALDIGVSDLSYGVVVSARRLADAIGDFAASLDGAWEAREEEARKEEARREDARRQAARREGGREVPQGRHRRNGRKAAAWGQGRNVARVISRWAR